MVTFVNCLNDASIGKRDTQYIENQTMNLDFYVTTFISRLIHAAWIRKGSHLRHMWTKLWTEFKHYITWL